MGRVLPLLALLSLFCLLTSAWPTKASLPSRPLPFKFTYMFTVQITLDLGYPTDPMPVPGGFQLTTPISNGTIAGPVANGTIDSGIASPSSLYNNTVKVPVIQAYGYMSDGTAFTISELGIGKPQAQVTRIVSHHDRRLFLVLMYPQQFSIGGGKKYDVLRNNYVLTTVTPSKDNSKVAVEVYSVENTAKAPS